MRPKLLITGVAPGFGVTLAARFATAGFDVAGVARSDTARAELTRQVEAVGACYAHLSCDATDDDAVGRLLAPIANDIAVWVHNAQSLLVRPFEGDRGGGIRDGLAATCLSAAVVAGHVLPAMARQGRGAAILSGATASRRGGPRFSAFASAKFALRGLSQSLAREYAPRGVHVVHVVIDGLIDAVRTDERFGPASGDRIRPGDIADLYLGLARQPASAWTSELDVRPQSPAT